MGSGLRVTFETSSLVFIVYIDYHLAQTYAAFIVIKKISLRN